VQRDWLAILLTLAQKESFFDERSSLLILFSIGMPISLLSTFGALGLEDNSTKYCFFLLTLSIQGLFVRSPTLSRFFLALSLLLRDELLWKYF